MSATVVMRVAGVFAALAMLLSGFGFSQSVPVAEAAVTAPCEFDIQGDQMRLQNDCLTTETIMVPDGMTLNGRNHLITAKDPEGGTFNGAVIKNEGSVANVINTEIRAVGLQNVCKSGDDRLRGILFEGASGTIDGNTIKRLNKNNGDSGCQEGNGIEVRNAPFDGTHPGTTGVMISNNLVKNYQKGGIIVNGDVDAYVLNNVVKSSASQDSLAANAIQIGFGAQGTVKDNSIGGNQWCGPSNYVATAVLVYQNGGKTSVRGNDTTGNADVGMYMSGDETMVVRNNNVIDDNSIADCNVNGYDIGIGAYGDHITVLNNTVGGFDTPIDGDPDGSGNKILRAFAPASKEPSPFF